MNKTTQFFKKNIFKLGIAASAALWILDTLVDSIGTTGIQGQDFFQHLLFPDLVNGIRRLFGLGFVLAFSAYAQGIFSRRNQPDRTQPDQAEQWRWTFEHCGDFVLVLDPERDEILDANPEACARLGFTLDELCSKKILEIYPDNSSNFQGLTRTLLEQGEQKSEAFFCQTKTGQRIPVALLASSIIVKGRRCIIALHQDKSEQKREESFHHLSDTVFKNANEGILVTDANGTILSSNPALSRLSGYSNDELMGQNARILKSGKHKKKFYEDMWKGIETNEQWEGEIWNRKKNGEIYPNRLAITAVKDPQGSLSHYIALFSDMSLSKQAEEKLHLQTHYDPLTGLANRVLALERLAQAIKNNRRMKGRAALLLVDLDRFKQVNDTFGHTGGDEILQQVARRLVSCLREIDTIARSGGDEFLIVLTNANRPDGPSVVAQKIITKMAQPFSLQGQEVFLGSSIGIAITPEDGDEVMSLLRNADLAMVKAKTEGSNRFRLFSGEMEKEARSRAIMEWDLRRALENKEFIIHYQPVFDLNTLETIALEALIRWKHPDKGLLAPGHFIRIAEESELISEIGKWILKAACTQVQQWREQNAYTGAVNVNVSTRQMVFDDFRTVVVDALNESGLPPECLTLEVTESLMLDAREDPIAKLNKLKELGIKLAIDDFGTGYSSLSYLWRYPIDDLKIDRSFILNIESDKNKQHLVSAIVRMGQSMKMKVVAEGVESQGDLMWLIDLGCDAAQGFYFSKPIPAEHFEKILKESGGKPAFPIRSTLS